MQRKIILYNFINDDADFKDADKDFEVGMMLNQSE